MSRLATSFVLGYHGCDKAVGEELIKGRTGLLPSDKDYDWLGPGAYFWESDPLRALEWATWKTQRGDYVEPYVVGAVIDLRNCLDLLARESSELLRDAYASFRQLREKSGLPMPENRGLPGQTDPDRKLRNLDCAVIRHLHEIVAIPQTDSDPMESFDTVRGMFTEGGELFEGSGFQQQTHIQIAVVNLDCLRGLFKPLPYPTLP